MIVYRYLSLRRHRQATLLCSATSLVRGRQFKAPSVHYATQNVGRLSAKLTEGETPLTTITPINSRLFLVYGIIFAWGRTLKKYFNFFVFIYTFFINLWYNKQG
ncbi:MAG: hypothetical protein E7603_09000 [Ruminococcaceae bacterium]|nr:hypothetical protein [Oscillospiraceae bacterium]